MNMQEVVRYLDNIIFSSTGKHFDSLQLAILKGVLNGQKYADIAQDYNCTAGHTKDEAYKLWQLLSEILGETINKSNFRATVERLDLANVQSPILSNKAEVLLNVNYFMLAGMAIKELGFAFCKLTSKMVRFGYSMIAQKSG